MARAYFGLAIAVVLWGTLHPTAKLALRGLAPAEFTFLRAALAGVALLAVCAATGRLGALRAELAHPLAAIALGTLGFAASNYLSMAALEYLAAGSNSVLAGTSPLFAFLGAPLLGERPGWLGAVGVALGFVGVALLASGGDMRGVALPGLILALAGAAAWAGYTLLGRRLGAGRDPIALTAASALVGAILLGALAGPAAVGAAIERASLDVRLAALWSGVAGTGATYALWASALRRLPASRVAPVQYLIPPMGLLFAWMILGEVPGPTLLLAATLILAGVAVAQRPWRLRARTASVHR